MAIASPVWNKFLFSPWADESSNVTELNFSEDDGEAVLTLLNIAHSKFCDVPKTLDYKQLYQVSLLCEQYDCHTLVEPWLEDWLQNEIKDVNLFATVEWLHIAWAFGKEDIFRRRAEILVRQIEITEGGKPFVIANVSLPDSMPDKLLTSILTIRDVTVRKLLELPYSKLDHYSRGDGTVCRRKRD
ncbi:hypothetical protein IFR05_005953 [Cadophora sp. M221]|nr:hypothetical protein IFR05_005953 [Cadophora sp. M221]